MTDREAGHALGEHPNRLRYAALTGTVVIRWEGARAPAVWTVPPPQVDPARLVWSLRAGICTSSAPPRQRPSPGGPA